MANGGLSKVLLRLQPWAEGLQDIKNGLCPLDTHQLTWGTRFTYMKQLGNTRHCVVVPSCRICRIQWEFRERSRQLETDQMGNMHGRGEPVARPERMVEMVELICQKLTHCN